MYEPEAADLLKKLGLSIAEEATPSEGEGMVVPLESVQALSAAMSLIGGDSGVSADVRRFCCLRYLFFKSKSGNAGGSCLRRDSGGACLLFIILYCGFGFGFDGRRLRALLASTVVRLSVWLQPHSVSRHTLVGVNDGRYK